MTHRNPKATLLVLLLCVGRAASRTWVHPGVLVGEAALQAAALDAASGAEPVASALAKALSSPLLVPGGVPVGQKWTDTGAVHCGSVSNPDFGCSQENANASAAYLRLLLWRLTGDTQHARLAGETMAAYASGVLAYTGSNACLQVAWGASKWARCAELARWPAPAPGWSEEKGAVFARWLASVHGPHLVSCTDSWAPGGNWGLSQAEALAGVAVATEDEALWERSQALLHARASAYVYSYALDGGADGPPPRPDRAGAGWGHGGGEHGWLRGWFGQSVFAAPSDGVAQETCRDLGHTLYGLAAASNAAETAWLQGDGGAAWGLLAPRLGPALELHAALELELGGDRPPPRRPWLCGGRAVALGDAVTLRPRYPTLEVARAALAGRLGLRMPNTEAYVAAVTRADPHPVDTGKSVGHMIVFESLTHGSGRLGAAAPGPPLLAPLPPSPGARFCLPAGGEGDGACYSVHSPFSTTVMANQLGGGVTLLLQTSPTKLRMVRAALGVWRGPASVALFARDPAEGAALRSSFRCASCVVSHVEAAGAPGAAAPAYPINLLRQLAVEAAPTDLCLVLDADFLPSVRKEGVHPHCKSDKNQA